MAVRVLRHRVDVVLCLCGFAHVDPFRQKLEEKGCVVEELNLAELPWFQELYGKYNIIEDNGKRWCEMRRLGSVTDAKHVSLSLRRRTNLRGPGSHSLQETGTTLPARLSAAHGEHGDGGCHAP